MSPVADPVRYIGGCVPLFLIALALDVVGVILLFVGIFANLRLDGRFYGDFFIYTGSLLVFTSLFCWIMWYAGNIPASEDYGVKKRSGGIALLARKLSERLSEKLRGEPRMCPVVREDDGSRVGETPPRKASRVTWGKSTAYRNEGYDDDDPEIEPRDVTAEKSAV